MNPQSPSPPQPKPKNSSNKADTQIYPYRFGEVGVMMGVIKRDHVRAALKEQRKLKSQGTEAKIGRVMRQLGWMSDRTVAAILTAQKKYRSKQEESLKGSNKALAPAANAAPSPKPKTESNAPNPSKEKSRSSSRQRLGDFELIEQIGEGSMGAVFKARMEGDDRTVALKVLPKNLANDREFVERFKREVTNLSQLDHPNVVNYLGSGHVSPYWFYYMEFVDGESLEQRIKRKGPMPEDEAIRVIRDTSRALAHAHDLGLIHRDIKPENVLLSRDGMVKVTDFGLAKQTYDQSQLTTIGVSIGTPYYLSPEQALGKQEVDHRADLYSLGVTFFQMTTGRLPFEDRSSTKVMVMHVQNPPPDPRSYNPAISRNTSKVILKLMEKNVTDRFQSANALINVLEKMMTGDQIDLALKSPKTGGTKHGENKATKKSRLGCLGKASMFALALSALFTWWIL